MLLRWPPSTEMFSEEEGEKKEQTKIKTDQARLQRKKKIKNQTKTNHQTNKQNNEKQLENYQIKVNTLHIEGNQFQLSNNNKSNMSARRNLFVFLFCSVIHLHIIIYNIDQWYINLRVAHPVVDKNLLGASIFMLFSIIDYFCRLKIHTFSSFIWVLSSI